MNNTTAHVQPTTAHVLTPYPSVGVSSRPVGTHAHECACGWRSVEHAGNMAACVWVETCPQSPSYAVA